VVARRWSRRVGTRRHGGAGKTAIAERFLRILPGVFPPSDESPTRPDLAVPQRLFVFSFYTVPNPDSFFLDLYRFLTGQPATSDWQPSFHQVLQLLQTASQSEINSQQSQIVLVLDGVEKIQHDGMRGGIFGEFTDRRLSDLLARIADGYLPHVSVLVTSRFPMAILDERSSPYYQQVAVDEIDEPTAIALLRQRGVRGTDGQLQTLALDCGLHALTVDLAGGWISVFRNGDPTAKLELTRFDDEEQARHSEPINARRRAIRLQEYRFARIADRYRAAFKECDPAALALLERICLFRIGVSEETLASIFTGEPKTKERISGATLAALSRQQLAKTLQHLEAMKLIEPNLATSSPSMEDRSLDTLYSIHPAVRDGFLAGLDEDTKRLGHEAVKNGLTISLGKAPGAHPTDRATLDLMEEIIYHAIQANHVAQAWHFYQARIGGCRNLIAKLNDYVRASRITKAFLYDTPSCPLSNQELIVLHNDFGYSHRQLGRMRESMSVLSSGFYSCQRQNDSNLVILGTNLARVQKCSGHLRSAIKTWRTVWENAPDEQVQLDALLEIAEIQQLGGHVHQTITESDFRDTGKPSFAAFVHEHLPLTVRSFLGDCDPHVAEHKQDIELLENECPDGHENLAFKLLSFAECLVRNAEFEAAEKCVCRARNWAISRDAMEILCWSALVQARIELARHYATVPPESERTPTTAHSCTLNRSSSKSERHAAVG
jgi:tetratricopeptide (TPR) repeat protein